MIYDSILGTIGKTPIVRIQRPPGTDAGRPKQPKDDSRSLAPAGTVNPAKRRAVATIQQLTLDHAAERADQRISNYVIVAKHALSTAQVAPMVPLVIEQTDVGLLIRQLNVRGLVKLRSGRAHSLNISLSPVYEIVMLADHGI